MLYNPKECGERKKVCPFFLLENSRPLSPWEPLYSLSTCLGTDSLISLCVAKHEFTLMSLTPAHKIHSSLAFLLICNFPL